jgi:hypothetical protein
MEAYGNGQTVVLCKHDILVWIRIGIRGSMPLTDGSGSGSWLRILLISSLTFKTPTKKFFCLLLFEGADLRIRIRNTGANCVVRNCRLSCTGPASRQTEFQL